jgi:hypothetical protein
MEQGYTIVWFGWQGDVLSGKDRMTFSVPAAKHPGSSPTPAAAAIRSMISRLVIVASESGRRRGAGWRWRQKNKNEKPRGLGSARR